MAFETTYTPTETQWLHDNYFDMDWKELEWNFSNKFGRHINGKTLRRKCYNDGLRKQVLGKNKSHYTQGDGRPRNSKSVTKETIFKIQCAKYGIVNALLKGCSPI